MPGLIWRKPLTGSWAEMCNITRLLYSDETSARTETITKDINIINYIYFTVHIWLPGIMRLCWCIWIAILCIFERQPVALVWLVVYLCCSCNHVWDEISVSWSVHQCHNFRRGLKLGHAHVHGHTPAANTDASSFRKKDFAICANWKMKIRNIWMLLYNEVQI